MFLINWVLSRIINNFHICIIIAKDSTEFHLCMMIIVRGVALKKNLQTQESLLLHIEGGICNWS